MTTETLLHIAVVLAAIVALAALGLWMFSEMFDADEQPVEPPRPKEWTSDYVRDNIHKLKPPPEPEH